MNKDTSRITVGKVLRIILIVILALFVGTCIFMFFKIRIDADSALRNAKNVRMSLRSADIEMYAAGKTIFNPSKKNGIEDGVKEKVNQYIEDTGTYSITSYSTRDHELTGMTYRQDNYVVYFSKSGENISWDVNLILNIYHYDETDVVE
ncbi:hypothetical protein SAMN02910369_01233 [Lachnospiraceae bacterium NE2001]|nr:hypothetical protein SAMN02910369_01233 [Lachnospiraceae bacterium NE2001]